MNGNFFSRIVVVFLVLFSLQSLAAGPGQVPVGDLAMSEERPNILDELNPFDPNIEERLKRYDLEQEEKTGQPSNIATGAKSWLDIFTLKNRGCYRVTCKVWAQIVKSTQVMYIYVDGAYIGGYYISTGLPEYETPVFDTHPNGRIYDKYTSTQYPDGDYNGLGNMPYAVFISGGFAIHGTTLGNVPKLGQRASHGCIRAHPDVAFYFNRWVRKVGVRKVWITVQE